MNILFLTSGIGAELHPHYNYNSGDMIIGKGVKQLILKSDIYSDPNFIDISRFVPKDYSTLDIDAVVYAGMPQYSKVPLDRGEKWIMYDIHREIAKLNKEYLMISGGSGFSSIDLCNNENKETAELLNRITRVITTRDSQSYDYLRATLGTGNIVKQPCASILAADYINPTVKNTHSYLIYTPSTSRKEEVKKFYKKLCREYNVVVVEHSLSKAKELETTLNVPVKTLIKPEDFIIYHQAHTVISHRLHGILYSWGAGVPNLLHQTTDLRASALLPLEIKSVPNFEYILRSKSTRVEELLTNSLLDFRQEIKQKLIDEFRWRYDNAVQFKKEYA